jgi:hypothetical protein
VSRSRIKWNRVAILASLALAIFVIVGVILAGRDELAIPPSTQAMQLDVGRINTHHISTKSWTVSFDHAEVAPDGSSATLTGVHDGVLYRKGRPYLKLSAAQILLNRATLDFTATGHVHIERIAQDQAFDTDSVIWTNSLKLLKLDHPAYLRTDGQTLKVENVTVDLTKNDVHIGKVDGEISVHSGKTEIPN